VTKLEELELINKYSAKLIADLNRNLAKCHTDVKELTRNNRRLRNIIKERSKQSNKRGR
jgi:hypothetical protein